MQNCYNTSPSIISLTIFVAPDFLSDLERAPGAGSIADEKSGVTIKVERDMEGVVCGFDNSQFSIFMIAYWELHPAAAVRHCVSSPLSLHRRQRHSARY
jgi:hypothetical protein